jgi:hypothetical protein
MKSRRNRGLRKAVENDNLMTTRWYRTDEGEIDCFWYYEEMQIEEDEEAENE